MALTSGARVGPYQVSALIGVGGMGEVYRATDTNLKREVAIKVLPDAVAADPERLARFQREAEVLASLNHPHIAQIHGLEKGSGATALVMELVDGQTLAERLAREDAGLKAQGSGLKAQGPGLPIDEALAIARQIADALEAAHEHGIVHRDLKPANIKLRPDGTVKVLDFGLAKAMERTGTMSPSSSLSPTITTPAMTQAGVILGTAAYMSPEQARGKSVDRRADVWAFGCVLYEMLSGRRAYEGEDVTDTLAAVLRGEPDWDALPGATPPALRRLVRRCLQRDPRQRSKDMGDVRLDLEEIAAAPSQPPPVGATAAPNRWASALPWLAVLAIGASAYPLKRVSLTDRLVTTVATNADFFGADWVSDDTVVFIRSGELWQVSASGGQETQLTMSGSDPLLHRWPRTLPGGESILVAGGDGSDGSWRIDTVALATGERHTVVERGTFPRYTPTGHLVFYRDGELLAAPFDIDTRRIAGATVRVVADLPGAGFTDEIPVLDVSASGVLAYAPTTSLSRLVWVSRQGAEQALATTPRGYANPRLDPGERWVLVQAGDLWIHDVARSTFRLLADAENNAYPVLTPDGTKVVFRTALGLRWQLTDGSRQDQAINGTGVQDYPATISRDGEQLLFVRLSPSTSGDIYSAQLNGDADVRPLLVTDAYEGSAKLSPDGQWLAYSSNDSGRMEVYLRPFPAPDRRWQVSTEGGTQPIWNPNGREIFYRSLNRMMAVTVSLRGDEPVLSEAAQLFDQPYAYGSGITIPNYDISADGERFVMVKEESSAGRLNVVINWFDELRRLVPVD